MTWRGSINRTMRNDITMDLQDGESVEVQGSAAKPYLLTNSGGVYSCTCPAWRNQSLPIEKRTCKHLRKLRGDEAEKDRIGGDLTPVRRRNVSKSGGTGDKGDAPPLLLAHPWDNATDVTDWWMSEKLDGVRAYWDSKRFVSRQGNEYMAPDWFVEQLPETPLDGELWMDRRKFQKTVSIVRRQDRSEHWKDIRFLIFDAPSADGRFEERLEYLADTVGDRHPYAQILEHSRCESLAHLQEELQRVESLGGEGLMLRQPASAYAVGRSMTLLKVKTFHDAEAVVIGHQPGKGRHKGRLGALLVQLPDGTEFSVGTGFSDAQREAPPTMGATITFRYQELTDAGVPRFPSFVRPGPMELQQGAAATAVSQAVQVAPQADLASKAMPAKAESQSADDGADSDESSSTASGRDLRYFEYEDAKSSKFWEIWRSGVSVRVRYGRIGADGAKKTKEFDDEDAAVAHMEKLIDQKTKKGYEENLG